MEANIKNTNTNTNTLGLTTLAKRRNLMLIQEKKRREKKILCFPPPLIVIIGLSRHAIYSYSTSWIEWPLVTKRLKNSLLEKAVAWFAQILRLILKKPFDVTQREVTPLLPPPYQTHRFFIVIICSSVLYTYN